MWRALTLAMVCVVIPLTAHAQNLNGTWAGLYTCGADTRAMLLTIEDTAPADGRQAFVARFDFADRPEDLLDPMGAFAMNGVRTKLSPTLGPIALFTSVEWIDRPEGFIPVNLYAQYGVHEGREIPSGEVYTERGPCRDFFVMRVNAPAADSPR